MGGVGHAEGFEASAENRCGVQKSALGIDVAHPWRVASAWNMTGAPIDWIGLTGESGRGPSVEHQASGVTPCGIDCYDVG